MEFTDSILLASYRYVTYLKQAKVRHLRNRSLISLLALLLALFCCSVPTVAQVPSTFFGMHMQTGVLGLEPWPAEHFGTFRFWDTNTGWADINTSEGVYKWTSFDEWLAMTKEHGVTDLLYTFGKTPAWASSDPSNITCNYGRGECAPPRDLNADGTGTNQFWKNFVQALVTHAAGRVKYWELWNEPNILARWTGTNAQLVRMASDAKTIILQIDPSAVLLTPCPADGITGTGTWMANYLADGGGAYADVIAFHGYVQHAGAYPVAEDVNTLIADLRKAMATYGQSSKPIWNTEGSWGRTEVTGFTNVYLQSSFEVRYILLQWSDGVARFYWYQWNNTNSSGVLWQANIDNPRTGTLLKPGIAYGEAYNWLVGATMSRHCSMATNDTWTCGLTRPGGYEGLAIWNTSGNKAYTAPSQYTQYRTVFGVVNKLPANHVMTIGVMPLLLEN
jgi:polysaccharide biosynthesis protein PslG